MTTAFAGLLQLCGLTTKAFAQEMNLTHDQVRNMATGRTRPSDAAMIWLAEMAEYVLETANSIAARADEFDTEELLFPTIHNDADAIGHGFLSVSQYEMVCAIAATIAGLPFDFSDEEVDRLFTIKIPPPPM